MHPVYSDQKAAADESRYPDTDRLKRRCASFLRNYLAARFPPRNRTLLPKRLPLRLAGTVRRYFFFKPARQASSVDTAETARVQEGPQEYQGRLAIGGARRRVVAFLQ